MRLLLRLLGATLAILGVTAVLLEVTLRTAQGLGVFSSQPRLTNLTSFYRDEQPAFGVWHPPNASYRAQTECFDVTYRSNSYGARDRERSERSSGSRVVVLGDSFAEGVGVEQDQRMTDLLEESTGIEHLNFGTAGNFSSIQEWQLYESLASKFDHQAVFLFMLPNNDFVENDPNRFWQDDRYRPYLRRDGDGYELYYPISLEAATRAARRQLPWNKLYNALYVYRLIAFFDTQLRVRKAQGPTTAFGYIGYEQFDDEDIDRLLFTYRKLRDAAGGRPLVLFTIPRLNDLLYFAGNGYPDRLPGILTAFARTEPGIYYADLLPGFVEDWVVRRRAFGEYFLPCDGHWSQLGNAVAAQVVERSVSQLGIGLSGYRPLAPAARDASAAPGADGRAAGAAH